MTGFDYIVLLIVGIAAAGGFMRGFLQEVLSLAAWVLAAFAIRALHTPLTLALLESDEFAPVHPEAPPA